MKGRSTKGRGREKRPKRDWSVSKRGSVSRTCANFEKEELTINFKVLCLLPGPRVSKVSIHPE